MILHDMGGFAHDYEVGITAGSHGTVLGRCVDNRQFVLGWANGPWNTEPDVIAWRYKHLMPILARTPAGCWNAVLAGLDADQAGSIGHLRADAMLPSAPIELKFREFESLGLRPFANEVGIRDGVPALSIFANGTAPRDDGGEHRLYVTAKEKLSQLSRLIKAVNLNPLLHDGQLLALRMSTADCAGFDRPRNIDVEELIATHWDLSVDRGRDGMAFFKMWDDRLLAMTADAGGTSLVDVTKDPMPALKRFLDWNMPGADLKFLDKCEQWLVNNGFPGKPISVADADARMVRELALLDEALR